MVSRDGRYGRAPTRQRYRCTDPAGQFHRFTPPLPRVSVDGGVCSSCDTEVSAQAGPVVSRLYRHRLHLVADALVAVGRGVSYSRASQRARVASGGDPLAGDGSGALVAEWVDVWAPVILDALAETEQPETLVLDSTDFHWTNRRTSTRRREFAILVAYGYTASGKKRVWGVRASRTATTKDYLELLADLRLPGPPVMVIADDDKAIGAAVRKMWPARKGPAPFLFACEHHLRARARDALKEDKAAAGRGRWMLRLDTAFRRPEGWEEFALAASELTHAAAWVKANNPSVTTQVERRHLLPAHHSNSGAESAEAALRDLFEHRSFALRNARRTNLLRGLARLHLNNLDDPGKYQRILREYAEQFGGQAPRTQRGGRDPYDYEKHTPIPSLR
jgi:hypothetical protein